MNCPKRANLEQNEAPVTILQSLFCNQYADLKKSGRDTGKARLNAIILFSAMLLLNAYSLFLLLEFLAPDYQVFRSLERLLKGFGSGRSATDRHPVHCVVHSPGVCNCRAPGPV